MEFKQVYIHMSTYKKLAEEYSKETGVVNELSRGKRSPYSIVFSAYSGRLLVHKMDRRRSWPGSWYKFYGGVYPTYRKVKGVPTFDCIRIVGTNRRVDESLAFAESGFEDNLDEYYDDIVCEIILVPDKVPEDVSAMVGVVRI